MARVPPSSAAATSSPNSGGSTPQRLSPSRHPAYSLSNIKNYISITLDFTNYQLWRELFLPVFKGYRVFDHIDGRVTSPPRSLIIGEGIEIPNPDFIQWEELDSLVLSWIQATVSIDILQAITYRRRDQQGRALSTARDVWIEIENLFTDQIAARTLQLQVQLHNLKKGDLSISDYSYRLRSMADELEELGSPVNEKDLVIRLLSEVPSEYHPVQAYISTGIPLPSFDEVRDMLLFYESHLRHSVPLSQDEFKTCWSLVSSTNSPRSARSWSGGLGDDHWESFPSPDIVCQLCFGPNHTARRCPFLSAKSASSDSSSKSKSFHTRDHRQSPASGATAIPPASTYKKKAVDSGATTMPSTSTRKKTAYSGASSPDHVHFDSTTNQRGDSDDTTTRPSSTPKKGVESVPLSVNEKKPTVENNTNGKSYGSTMRKLIVILNIQDGRDKQKALEKVSSVDGIEYVDINIKEQKLTILGRDFDVAKVLTKLRKLFYADIVSLGPATPMSTAASTPDNQIGHQYSSTKQRADSGASEKQPISTGKKAATVSTPEDQIRHQYSSTKQTPNSGATSTPSTRKTDTEPVPMSVNEKKPTVGNSTEARSFGAAMRKLIVKLNIQDDREKQKALKAISSVYGIEYVDVNMKEKKLTVVGDMDPTQVLTKLRKLFHAEMISLGPANDQPRRVNSVGANNKETKKDVPKKGNEQVAEMVNPYRSYGIPNHYVQYYYYPYPQYYYPYYYTQSNPHHNHEENPNTCVIS